MVNLWLTKLSVWKHSTRRICFRAPCRADTYLLQFTLCKSCLLVVRTSPSPYLFIPTVLYLHVFSFPFSLGFGQCEYTMGLVMALVFMEIVEAVGFPHSFWDHSSRPGTPHLLSLRSGRDIKWKNLLKVLNNLQLERCTDETQGGKTKKT